MDKMEVGDGKEGCKAAAAALVKARQDSTRKRKEAKWSAIRPPHSKKKATGEMAMGAGTGEGSP